MLFTGGNVRVAAAAAKSGTGEPVLHGNSMSFRLALRITLGHEVGDGGIIDTRWKNDYAGETCHPETEGGHGSCDGQPRTLYRQQTQELSHINWQFRRK